MQTSNRGSIYLVSHSNGAVYELARGDDDDEDDNDEDNEADDDGDDDDDDPLGRRLEATLSGANAVPRGNRDGAGSMSMTFDDREGRVCFDLRLDKVDLPATAAVIRAGDDEVGTTVLDLGRITGNSTSSCVPVDKETLQALHRGSSDHHVVVRNAEFEFGAVRGRLSKKG
jgi:hypothetical protein